MKDELPKVFRSAEPGSGTKEYPENEAPGTLADGWQEGT